MVRWVVEYDTVFVIVAEVSGVVVVEVGPGLWETVVIAWLVHCTIYFIMLLVVRFIELVVVLLAWALAGVGRGPARGCGGGWRGWWLWGWRLL